MSVVACCAHKSWGHFIIHTVLRLRKVTHVQKFNTVVVFLKYLTCLHDPL